MKAEVTFGPDTFTCDKYHCTLTRQACADRQAAIRLHGVHKLPMYPGCQQCEQGAVMAFGVISTDKKQITTMTGGTQEGRNMGHQKIDDDKLKRLLAEGKHVNVIAKDFGVHHTAVRRHIKILGLTPNYSRKRAGSDTNPTSPISAPVRQPANNLTYKPEAVPAQIIPVTLRLTVEVNVRVNAQGCN